MRGTSNANARGNTKDRYERRRWLIEAYEANRPGFCRCYRCGILLTLWSLTVDRVIPGCRGGTYRRNNIRPSCALCASITGGGTRR